MPVLYQYSSRAGAGYDPRQMFLFSGHMIDHPQRTEPRFPVDKEAVAGAAIATKLDELGAGTGDLAICGGACGGDILFAEACLARGLRLEIHIQYDEPEFLAASVSFGAPSWVERFNRLKAHPNTVVLVMPDELGPLSEGDDPYVRNNLWQLDTALGHGAEKVVLIALWDGKSGDGPGGTQHLIETVRKFSGQVHILDIGRL